MVVDDQINHILHGLTDKEFSEAEKSSPFYKRTPQPTLVVGLGGTGAEVAARLKQRLKLHYQKNFSLGSEMIKFLVLDTISLTKQPNNLVKELFSDVEEEYVNLGEDFNAFNYLNENYSRDPNLLDWWDNRYNITPQYQEWGAKRVRQLGRLFLYQKHLQVEALIQQKVIDTCTLYEDLIRGQRLADVGSNFRIYIISSNCGGTGSGIFFDIVYKIWVAITSQGRVPEIRAFIFFPGLYEDEARKRSLELVQAHRANAYAFLKELDYFLTPGSDLNRYILDAKTRDPSQLINIPPGSLLKYTYLIDRQLGSLGNLDRPEDAYNLVSDAMFQMIITPVGQEEEGIGLTNIDAVIQPSRRLHGKRTAYSSLGLSRILFPKHTLHARLTYRLLKDLIYQGFLNNQSWMTKVLREDQRLSSLVSRLGQANMQAIDNLTADAWQLVMQVPTPTNLKKASFSEQLEQVITEKDLNDTRVIEGLNLIDKEFESFQREAKREAKALIINLINSCEYGFIYAQKLLLEAKKQLKQLLKHTRQEYEQYLELKSRAEKEVNAALKDIERLDQKRLVLFKKRQADRRCSYFAIALRNLTEASLLARKSEKKVTLLGALAGQEQIIEQKLGGGVVIGRRVVKSIVDQEIDKVNLIINQLTQLAARAEQKEKLKELSQVDRGVTITTQIFPPQVLDLLDKTSFKSIYQKEVNQKSMGKHLQQILAKFSENADVHEQELYYLSDPNKREAVIKLLVAKVAAYAEQLFKNFLNQNVIEAVIETVGQERLKEQVMSNLFELSQPCWNFDKQKVGEAGMTDLPRTYSLGYVQPDQLPLPEGQKAPGFVKTEDDHQITLLQAQHGLPLFALRVIPKLRADYLQFMRLMQKGQAAPLHLNQNFNDNLEALPDIKVQIEISPTAIRDFALGMFTDYLVLKKDPVVLSLLQKKPIDERNLRGLVHTANGKEFYLTKLELAGNIFVMGPFEVLASTGLVDAVENFAGYPAARKMAGSFFSELIKRKQYRLINDLETYLNQVLVVETKKNRDREEKVMLKRAYELLSIFLNDLKTRKKKAYH